MASRSVLVVLCAFVIGLAGCQPRAAAVPPTADAVASATSLPTASPTQRPSHTPLPSLTPTLTRTATLVPSPVVSPTLEVAYAELKLLSVENRVGGWMVTFTLPGIRQPLKLLLGGNTYNCLVDDDYADRLFCQGLAKPAYDTPLSLAFLDEGTGAKLYESSLVFPSALLVPPTPAGWANTNCAERGQNVSCETECRIAPNGSPCIVATCTDACGPYFSVHTCPDMSLDFPSCTAEQWAYMKKLYQIP